MNRPREPQFSDLPIPFMALGEQERNRIALEDAISHGLPDFSIQPSEDADYSVEYPRHGGAHSPLPFNPYSSFNGPEVADDLYSNPDQHRHRSFVSHHDDSLVGGESMSTAAHHASALTPRAGLRYNLPSPTLGDGEYDPERPVQDLLNNRGHMSIFDDTMRSTKSERRANTSTRNRSHHNKSRDIHLQVSLAHFA